jgi:hypothetical protein
MKTQRKIWTRVASIMCALCITVACDNADPMGSGEAEFEITDAPIDDANVEGVFVTVTDVKVNGNSIAGFSGKQTINLKAYQEGATKLLGNAELNAKTYNSITLVLDLDTDASGNAPGCYVKTADNVKHKLATTASGQLDIAVNKAWAVRQNAKSRIVMDFDLRKSIRYTGEETVKYSFVSSSELNSAVRVVDRSKCATIQGTFDGDFDSGTERIVVYAYKKGTYNASTETQADAGGVMFKNAVSSTMVKTEVLADSYTLAFIEAGEYNLVFVRFTKDNASGRFMFNSVLNTQTSVNGSVSNFITVKAGVNVIATASVFI